jgi:hypothetical protein
LPQLLTIKVMGSCSLQLAEELQVDELQGRN